MPKQELELTGSVQFQQLWASLVAQMAKNLLAMQIGSVPGLGKTLEEGMAIHSSVLAWGILWAEEPGRLQSMG